jgi:hypothetical protein
MAFLILIGKKSTFVNNITAINTKDANIHHHLQNYNNGFIILSKEKIQLDL